MRNWVLGMICFGALSACVDQGAEPLNEPASAAREPRQAMNSQPRYASFYDCARKTKQELVYIDEKGPSKFVYVLRQEAAWGQQLRALEQRMNDKHWYHVVLSTGDTVKESLMVKQDVGGHFESKAYDAAFKAKQIEVDLIRIDGTHYAARMYSSLQSKFAELSANLWVAEGVVEEWRNAQTDIENLYTDPRLEELQASSTKQMNALDNLLRSVSEPACKDFLGAAYANEILAMQGRLNVLMKERAPFYFSVLRPRP